jgi:hypothetical protein
MTPPELGIDMASELLADTAIALGAFGLLLRRYTEETVFSVWLHAGWKAARIVRI